LLRAPGQDRERRGVGQRDHVRLLDRVEAGDRGAVEAHPALERVVELERVDREALELAEDVGEPEPDEAHVALLHDSLDVLAGARAVGLLHLGGHIERRTISARRAYTPCRAGSTRGRRDGHPIQGRRPYSIYALREALFGAITYVG